jgi:hypothetical protein
MKALANAFAAGLYGPDPRTDESVPPPVGSSSFAEPIGPALISFISGSFHRPLPAAGGLTISVDARRSPVLPPSGQPSADPTSGCPAAWLFHPEIVRSESC